MVNAVYDHIIAILVVGAIFVGAVVILPAMSFANLQAVDQQQLRNTALNVFNAVLLDTGEPSNWGSMDPFDMKNVTRFGLASAQGSTFYVLDPDKVQRLVKGNPIGEINYTRVKELLGLQGYGFSLRLIPPFNVTKEDGTPITPTNSPANLTEPNKLDYAVKVTYLDGRPIPNATILATIVYTDGNRFNTTGPCSKWTDAVGVCKDDIKLEFAPTSWTVILRVSAADVATLIVTFGRTPKIMDINMVGDKIILTKPKDPSNAAVNVTSVYAVGEQNSLWLLYEGQGPPYDKFNTGEGTFRLWPPSNHPTYPDGIFHGLSSYNPTILIFSLETSIKKDEGLKPGHQELVVAGPYQNFLGHTVFKYGDSSKSSGSASVKIQRSVIISGMTYIAELLLWKESP